MVYSQAGRQAVAATTDAWLNDSSLSPRTRAWGAANELLIVAILANVVIGIGLIGHLAPRSAALVGAAAVAAWVGGRLWPRQFGGVCERPQAHAGPSGARTVPSGDSRLPISSQQVKVVLQGLAGAVPSRHSDFGARYLLPTDRAGSDSRAQLVKVILELSASARPRDAEAGHILIDYYLKGVGTHEVVMERLHLSRPTFYRRLNTAFELVAERLDEGRARNRGRLGCVIDGISQELGLGAARASST